MPRPGSQSRRFRLAVPFVLALSLVLAACDSGIAPTATPVANPAVSSATSTAAQPVAPTTAPTAQEATTQPTTTQPSGQSGSAPEIKNPDTMVESTVGELSTLDPAYSYDTASNEVIFQVYEPLLTVKREKVTEFVPLLATKWDISSDGKTYTFTIRKGVKFHDGEDLTPEDVAYSFQRGMIQDRSGGPQWILLQPFFGLSTQSFKGDVVEKQNNKDWVKACQAVQQAVTYDNAAGTVTMNLHQPYGPMLQILSGGWGSILSKPWVIKQGGWDGNCKDAEKYNDPKEEQDELFKIANGTGPFKLERWAQGEEIDLARNDNYWLKEPLWEGAPTGPAKLAHVVIKYVKEWGTRYAAFKAGDVDILYVDRQYSSQIDPSVKETCDYGKDCVVTNPSGYARLYKGLPQSASSVVELNQAVNTTGGNNRLGSGKLDGAGIPPDFFSDIHIRKALNYCFDWQTYIQQAYNGEAEQILGPIIRGLIGYDANQAHYSFDLTKCADEFKASTLKSPDGKSLWDTGFILPYVYISGDDQNKTVGEILKDNLAKVNPKFQVSMYDEPFAAIINDYLAGVLPMSEIGWQEDFHDPHDWATPFLASSGAYAGVQHFPQDLQSKLDSMIAQAAASTDPAARADLYKQLQNMAYENALDIYIVQPQGRYYTQQWVKGWYYNPTYTGSSGPGTYFYVLSKGQ